MHLSGTKASTLFYVWKKSIKFSVSKATRMTWWQVIAVGTEPSDVYPPPPAVRLLLRVKVAYYSPSFITPAFKTLSSSFVKHFHSPLGSILIMPNNKTVVWLLSVKGSLTITRNKVYLIDISVHYRVSQRKALHLPKILICSLNMISSLTCCNWCQVCFIIGSTYNFFPKKVIDQVATMLYFF